MIGRKKRRTTVKISESAAVIFFFCHCSIPKCRDLFLAQQKSLLWCVQRNAERSTKRKAEHIRQIREFNTHTLVSHNNIRRVVYLGNYFDIGEKKNSCLFDHMSHFFFRNFFF